MNVSGDLSHLEIAAKNSIETYILSSVKQIASLHETSAQGWCTGKTQREGMGREVGGGFRMGRTHVNPWLIHVNVWQKPLQYCKVITLQLIKINEKTKTKTEIAAKDCLPFMDPLTQVASRFFFCKPRSCQNTKRPFVSPKVYISTFNK